MEKRSGSKTSWPFGPGHRPLRGWLMSQDPTLQAERLAPGAYGITSAVDGSHHLVAFNPRGAVCSCDDFRRVRRPQATKTSGGHAAACAHVWMMRFRLGEFPDAEPPAELREQPVKGFAREDFAKRDGARHE